MAFKSIQMKCHSGQWKIRSIRVWRVWSPKSVKTRYKFVQSRFIEPLNISFLLRTLQLRLAPHSYSRAKASDLAKGWFTLDAAVCVFRSGLRQRRDRKFSISLQKRNCLPQTHAENAVMWISLKRPERFNLASRKNWQYLYALFRRIARNETF